MKKILFFVLLSAIICSCNPIPDKPCYEVLTVEELAKVNKADSNFLAFYEYLQEETDIYDMNDIEKAKYQEINYSRLYKYLKFISDVEHWYKAEDIYSAKWHQEFDATIKSTDSLIAVYQKEKQEAFAEVNKLVSLELIDLQCGIEIKPAGWDMWGYWRSEKIEGIVDYTIKLNFSNPKISNVETVLYFWEKDGSKSARSVFLSGLYYIHDLKGKKQIKDRYKQEHYDALREYYSYNTFKQKCDYEFRIYRIIMGNDTIVADYPNDKYEYSLIKKQFSKEWLQLARFRINSKMVSQEEYVEEQIELEREKFDALCYEMVNEFF